MKAQVIWFGMLMGLISLSPQALLGQSFGQLKDINPGSTGSSLKFNRSSGYFVAYIGFTPYLYYTDGTSQGTNQLIKMGLNDDPFFKNVSLVDNQEVFSLTPSGTPTFIGKNFIFPANGSLFRSDGTAAGTVAIAANINPGNSGLVHKGVLYFQGSSNLSRSDGTAAGTTTITRRQQFNIRNMYSFGDKFVFSGDDRGTTLGYELWTSDGTDAGTVLIKDIQPGSSSGSNPSNFASINNKLLFLANDGQGTKYWVSDGTTAGTTLLKSDMPGNHSEWLGICPKDNILYFRQSDDLWRTDGTAAGTYKIDIPHKRYDFLLTEDGLFVIDDSNKTIVKVVGDQLIRGYGLTNGTQAGNLLGYKKGALYSYRFSPNPNNPSSLIGELWRSDNTPDGSYRITNFSDDTYASQYTDGTYAKRPILSIGDTFYGFNAGLVSKIEQKDGKDVGSIILDKSDILSRFSMAYVINGRIVGIGSEKIGNTTGNTEPWVFDSGVSTCGITVSATTNNVALCSGGIASLSASVTGGTAPLTYQWSLNGTAISGATSTTYAATAAGSYVISVTDSKTCTATSSALTISVATPPANVTATNTGPYDVGQTIQLNASGGSTYTWKGPANFTATGANPTLPNATTVNAGSYTVTASTSSACPTATATTTVTIRGVLLPPTISASQSSVCAGTSVSLIAQGCTGTIRWSSGQTGASITVQPTVPTTYTAVCEADGRSSAASNAILIGVTATPAPPTITTSNVQIVSGSSVTLTAATSTTGSLQWLQDGNPIIGATSLNYVTTQAGAYSLRITNSSGCTATSTTLAINLVTALEPLIPLDDNQVTVYPNPTTSGCWVAIDVMSKQTVYLHLIDVMGKSVRQWNVQAAPKMQPLQVSLPEVDGLYFLRIETANGLVVKKVVRVK